MLFSNNNSDDISPKNDTFEPEGVENWEDSKQENKFKEVFPKIEDLKNAWYRADDSEKEEIASYAGSSDWSEILNIYRNS